MSRGYIVLYRLIDLESAAASGKGLGKAAEAFPPPLLFRFLVGRL